MRKKDRYTDLENTTFLKKTENSSEDKKETATAKPKKSKEQNQNKKSVKDNSGNTLNYYNDNLAKNATSSLFSEYEKINRNESFYDESVLTEETFVEETSDYAEDQEDILLRKKEIERERRKEEIKQSLTGKVPIIDTEEEYKQIYNTQNIKLEKDLKNHYNKSKQILKDIEEREKQVAFEQEEMPKKKSEDVISFTRSEMMERRRKETLIRLGSIIAIVVLLIILIPTVISNRMMNTELEQIAVLTEENEQLKTDLSNVQSDNDMLEQELAAINAPATDTTETIDENGEVVDTGIDENTDAEAIGTPSTYTVKAGDNLWQISMDIYGSADYVDAIASANGISGGNITVGQVLTLPAE